LNLLAAACVLVTHDAGADLRHSGTRIGCMLVGWRLDKRSEMMRQRSFW
jgi:hypothetical protein